MSNESRIHKLPSLPFVAQGFHSYDLGAAVVNGHDVDLFIDVAEMWQNCARIAVSFESEGKNASTLISDDTIEVVKTALRGAGFDLGAMTFAWRPENEQYPDVVHLSATLDNTKPAIFEAA